MNTAILIHGTPSEEEYFSELYPSPSNSHWFPWLQKALLARGRFTQTPEMPEAYKPDYALWKKEFERFDIDDNTILVGHSCGGGFLLRWLSENNIRPEKVILVAPWLDPDRIKTTDFFDFEIDENLGKRTNLCIFNSDNDDPDIHVSVDLIRKTIPNHEYRLFKGYGHFCYGDMDTYQFDELLDTIEQTQ